MMNFDLYNELHIITFNSFFDLIQIIEMRVHMDCPGCESKVRTALEKLKGTFSYTYIHNPRQINLKNT